MGDSFSAAGPSAECSRALPRVLMALLLGATVGWMTLLMLIAAWPDPKTPPTGAELGASAEAYLAHFVLFAVLGALVYCDVLGWKGRRYVLAGALAATVVGVAWGAVTEWYQLYVPKRDASSLDVLADLAGAACGGVAAAVLIWLVRTPRLPKGTQPPVPGPFRGHGHAQ